MNSILLLILILLLNQILLNAFSPISINDINNNKKSLVNVNKLFSLPTTIYQDVGVSTFGLIASYGWLKIWISLANNGKIDPNYLGRLYIAVVHHYLCVYGQYILMILQQKLLQQ